MDERLGGPLAAMAALGEAWRGSWADFDGRTLRSQLEELAGIFRAAEAGEDVTAAVAAFYSANRICPDCRGWTEYCDHR